VVPKGLTSQCVRSCCTCGVVISEHGGGGNHICKPCIRIILDGLLANEFRAMQQKLMGIKYEDN
jgi:hypothetical protein